MINAVVAVVDLMIDGIVATIIPLFKMMASMTGGTLNIGNPYIKLTTNGKTMELRIDIGWHYNNSMKTIINQRILSMMK